ncbi:hypothetical protein Droror1_Dr00024624 [Drosera rotundifolia]
MVVWSSNKVEMGFVLCFAMPSLELVFDECGAVSKSSSQTLEFLVVAAQVFFASDCVKWNKLSSPSRW